MGSLARWIRRDAVTSAPDDLVRRLRDNDAAAVAEAYDAHGGHLRAFAVRLVGDAAAADDLVQDVFVVLPEVIRNFRGESTLRTFLVGVAIRRAKQFVRAAARRRAAGERMSREPEGVAGRPDEAHDQRETMDAIQRALDELPLEQRMAFVLCDVEERTAPEVALLMSVPEATVRTRLFHARRKLRESLTARGVR
jgi:RNA polymerase sigma-70 factor (ECF subfamily)